MENTTELTQYAKRREYFRAYSKRRYHEDEQFRLATLLRMARIAQTKKDKITCIENEHKDNTIQNV
jgi:hypothetical protein